jgi:hypothetical protein
MSDGITDAEREGREIAEEWKRREIQSFFSARTTKELVDELSKREGVRRLELGKNETYCIASKERHCIFGDNAATILVVNHE